MRLSADTQAAGYRLVLLETTGSTNDDAAEAARAGDAGQLWIVAREQRSGRGRHGRQWSSPPGNLYASLLLVDPCEPARAPQLGFIAGLALHQAVEAVLPGDASALTLKWPNDLLLGGAKLAGLLLEGHRLPGGSFAVVIGFGLNVTAAPASTPYPARSLREVLPGASPDLVFPALAAAFARSYEAWRDRIAAGGSDPFAETRERWLRRAAGIGSTVCVRLPTGEVCGRFENLDEVGRLQLSTAQGLASIDAGDLYFPEFHSPAGMAPAPMRS